MSECLKGESHYWLIEEPNGVASVGKCKKCGTAGEFLNAIPIEKFYWNNAIRPIAGKGHGLTKQQVDKKLKKSGLVLPTPGFGKKGK